jgi:hypothetical protein
MCRARVWPRRCAAPLMQRFWCAVGASLRASKPGLFRRSAQTARQAGTKPCCRESKDAKPRWCEQEYASCGGCACVRRHTQLCVARGTAVVSDAGVAALACVRGGGMCVSWGRGAARPHWHAHVTHHVHMVCLLERSAACSVPAKLAQAPWPLTVTTGVWRGARGAALRTHWLSQAASMDGPPAPEARRESTAPCSLRPTLLGPAATSWRCYKQQGRLPGPSCAAKTQRWGDARRSSGLWRMGCRRVRDMCGEPPVPGRQQGVKCCFVCGKGLITGCRVPITVWVAWVGLARQCTLHWCHHSHHRTG